MKSFQYVLHVVTCLIFAQGCGFQDSSSYGTEESGTSEYCKKNDAKYFEVPASYSGANKNKKIKLAYQEFPAKKDNPRTVLYLPGGPANRIGNVLIRDRIPDIYRRIQIDYRGLGCSSKNFKTEDLNSDTMALDVLALIETLGIDDYVIFGNSFGSAVATKAAALIEIKGITSPRAVVIDGVIGGVFEGDRSVSKGLKDGWKIVKGLYSEPLKEELKKDQPLGIDRDTWVRFVIKGLYAGTFWGDDEKSDQSGQYFFPLYSYPEWALRSVDEMEKATVIKQIKEFSGVKNNTDEIGTPSMLPNNQSESQPVDVTQVTMIVLCREFYRQHVNVLFDKSELRDGDYDHCKYRASAIKTWYDPKNYQFDAPITYFSGALDPVTNTTHTFDHIKSRRPGTKVQLIQVSGGGHGLILNFFGAPKCRDEMWRRIFERESLKTHVINEKKCGPQVQYKSNY